MATRNDVAKQAKVSPSTVSNVLTGKKYVSPELMQKVMKAVEELDYTPNFTARALVTRRSYQLALLVHEIVNPYYSEIAEGVEEIARLKGYTVSFHIVHEKTAEYFNTIRQRGVDGLFSLTLDSFTDEQMQYFRDNHIAFVSMSQNLYGSSVRIRYAEAAKHVMQLLASCGHKNIAFISGFECSSDEERYAAYYDFFAKSGYGINENYVRFGGYPQYRSFDLGYKYAHEILESCPEVTAIFALNDLMAYGAIKAAHDMGFSIPKDVSIVGCDNIFSSAMLNPALTTINVNKIEIGRKAARLLINQIETKKTEEIFEDADLITRDSVSVINSN